MTTHFPPNQKAVVQFDLDGKFVKEWESIADAAEHFGVVRTSIRKATNTKGKRNYTSCGFVWRLKSEFGQSVPMLISTGFLKDKFRTEKMESLKKPVEKVDAGGNVISTYQSVSDAAVAAGVHKGTISERCTGGRIVNGYLFRFASTHKNGKVKRSMSSGTR